MPTSLVLRGSASFVTICCQWQQSVAIGNKLLHNEGEVRDAEQQTGSPRTGKSWAMAGEGPPGERAVTSRVGRTVCAKATTDHVFRARNTAPEPGPAAANRSGLGSSPATVPVRGGPAGG